jgi:2-hydroxychromene-2-carboxylate isomerase
MNDDSPPGSPSGRSASEPAHTDARAPARGITLAHPPAHPPAQTPAHPSAHPPAQTPTPTLSFWFDFISPFGFLASLRIDELARRHGRTVTWRPLLVGITVLKVMGLPPVPQTPLKGPYAARQIARYLRRHQLVLARDPLATPMNPLPAGRLFAWLRVHAPDSAHAAAQAIYHAYWMAGRPMDDAAALRDVVVAAGVPAAVVDAGLSDTSAAGLLRAEVDAAIAVGAFGSPFFVVDGEPFFGVDSLELLDEWLSRGGW